MVSGIWYATTDIRSGHACMGLAKDIRNKSICAKVLKDLSILHTGLCVGFCSIHIAPFSVYDIWYRVDIQSVQFWQLGNIHKKVLWLYVLRKSVSPLPFSLAQLENGDSSLKVSMVYYFDYNMFRLLGRFNWSPSNFLNT